jgi:excisionase family DNA binding protein
MDALLLSKKQAASVLGISIRSVEYMLANGRLEGRRLGRRRLVTRRSIEKLARIDVPTMSPPKKATARADLLQTQQKRKENENADQSPRVQPQR